MLRALLRLLPRAAFARCSQVLLAGTGTYWCAFGGARSEGHRPHVPGVMLGRNCTQCRGTATLRVLVNGRALWIPGCTEMPKPVQLGNAMTTKDSQQPTQPQPMLFFFAQVPLNPRPRTARVPWSCSPRSLLPFGSAVLNRPGILALYLPEAVAERNDKCRWVGFDTQTTSN